MKLAVRLFVALTGLSCIMAGCYSQQVQLNDIRDFGSPGWIQDTTPTGMQWYVGKSWSGLQWEKSTTAQIIEEETGVQISFIWESGEHYERLTSLNASGLLPDLVTLPAESFQRKKLVTSNMVYPLSNLAIRYDPYFYSVADEKTVAWYTRKDGELYAYPGGSLVAGQYGAMAPPEAICVVRKDLYEAIGSPDMSTPIGFLDALRSARIEFPYVNGKELNPFGCLEFTQEGCRSLDRDLLDFLGVPYASGGQLEDRIGSPEYREWLQVFWQAGRERLLHWEILTDKAVQVEEKITAGQYFCLLYSPQQLEAAQILRYEADPQSAYMAIPGPRSSSGAMPVLSGPSLDGEVATMISRDSESPDRAIRLMGYLISERGQQVAGFAADEQENELLYDFRSGNPRNMGREQKLWMLENREISLESGQYLHRSMEQILLQNNAYTVDTAPYIGVVQTAQEEARSAVFRQLWGKTLLSLLTAESADEWDDLWEEYFSQRDQLGWRDFAQQRQDRFEKNLAVLDEIL